MSVQLTEDQINLINKIAQTEGISDFQIEANSGSIKGDGYLGIISTVKVKNGNKSLDLILKSADQNKTIREKNVIIRRAYLREIYAYENIFPEFESFQKGKEVSNCFSAHAKIYGSCSEENNEYLILENLREIGYKIWNRKIPMNSDHVALVMSEYGKLHAVSFAMKDQKPDFYRELTKDLGSIFEDTGPKEDIPGIFDSILENGVKAVKGNSLATEAMKRFQSEVYKFITEDLETSEDQLVITHGDCWCNNLMFKYEDSRDFKKPTKVCLLDWQLSRIGSPVLDLSYFFIVCSKKEVLYDYKKYLNIYYKTLSDNLKQLSCDPEKIFPFALLEYHWKKYARYGLYMGIMIIKLMLSETDEVPGFEDENSFLDAFNFEGANINDYNQRILDIVNVMAENDLI